MTAPGGVGVGRQHRLETVTAEGMCDSVLDLLKEEVAPPPPL